MEPSLDTHESRRHFQYAYGINDGVNPVQETDGVNVLANMLTGLGIDEVFLRTDTAGGSSFLTDALGSTVALSDSGGVTETEYTYEPFGGTTVSGISSTNSFQYTGRENDGTGLYYYRARYYHPGLQRFASEDPLQCHHRIDKNLYTYVRNNPLHYTDPLGLTEHEPGSLGDPGSGDPGSDAPPDCGRKDCPPPQPPGPDLQPPGPPPSSGSPIDIAGIAASSGASKDPKCVAQCWRFFHQRMRFCARIPSLQGKIACAAAASAALGACLAKC